MTDISRRHSGRITKSTPILLLGCDAEGRVFSEETRTVILSFHGLEFFPRTNWFPNSR